MGQGHSLAQRGSAAAMGAEAGGCRAVGGRASRAPHGAARIWPHISPEPWRGSFPRNRSSQKCNTAFYSLVSTQNTAPDPSHPLLPLPARRRPLGRRPVCGTCPAPRWPVHGLLHRHGGGPVNGLHHSCKAAAEVVGGVGPDLWGLLQDNNLSGAVEEPRQELAQLHLQLRCQGEEREESAAPGRVRPGGRGV